MPHPDIAYGAVIVTALLTLILFGLVAALEHTVLRWRPPAQADTSW